MLLLLELTGKKDGNPSFEETVAANVQTRRVP